MRLPAPPLLLVTDRSQARRPLADVVAAAFAAGCRWASLREKDMMPAERRDLLARLVAAGRPSEATVTVHGDLAAAAEAGAAGVHLAAGGDPVAARRTLGAATLVGISCHGAGEVDAALGAGADYVTLGPVAETASKLGYRPALGMEGFARICRCHPGRVVALGGVAPDAVPGLLAAGAAGIAVMGPVMRADDPGAVVERYLAALAQGVRG